MEFVKNYTLKKNCRFKKQTLFTFFFLSQHRVKGLAPSLFTWKWSPFPHEWATLLRFPRRLDHYLTTGEPSSPTPIDKTDYRWANSTYSHYSKQIPSFQLHCASLLWVLTLCSWVHPMSTSNKPFSCFFHWHVLKIFFSLMGISEPANLF